MPNLIEIVYYKDTRELKGFDTCFINADNIYSMYFIADNGKPRYQLSLNPHMVDFILPEKENHNFLVDLGIKE